VLSATTNPEEFGFLMLSPYMMRLTGMLYADTTALPGIEYSYSIRPVTLRGEQTEIPMGSIIYSELPLIPSSLISVQAKYAYSTANVSVEYFPREQMQKIMLYRLQEGTEPILIGQYSTPPPSASTPRATMLFSDTTVVNGTIVRYRAYGADNWDNKSEPKESNELFIFDIYEDYYVTNPTISAIGDEALQISWAEDKKHQYYKEMIIYRATEAEGVYQPKDTVPFTDFSWRDTDVFPEQFYYYRLQRVYISGDTSDRSPYFTAQFEVLLPPPPPSQVSASASATGIEVTWQPPVYKHPMLGYYVYRSTDGGENFFLLASLDSTHRSWRDTSKNLYPYKEIMYSVQAINLSRVMGAQSDTIAVLPYLDSLTLPANALWGATLDDENLITVHLSDYSQVHEFIVGWNIYRADADGSNIQKINPELLKDRAFQDKTVFPKQTYRYYHTIVDSRGNESGLSEPYNITYEPLEIFYPQIELVEVQYQGENVTLSWQPVAHKDFTSYIILRSDKDGVYKEIAKQQEATFTQKIKRNTVYRYKVVAVFGENLSEASPEVTVLR
jgi:fibronectin type 3 domain-containing protein